MASPFEADFFGGLGASGLLKDLRGVQDALETISATTTAADHEPELPRSLEQVGDLIDIVQSFNELATQERRNPSVHQKFRSANALLHLQSVLDSAAAILDECALFIRPLQSGLESIADQREAAGYVTTESRLEHQPWYEETLQALQLLTELLRALSTAIDLLQYQHGTNDDVQLLEARSSTSTQLHFQIGLVEQKLHFDGPHNTIAVRNAIQAARAVTVYIPPIPNQHFVIARPVKTYFTGRAAQLAKLEAAFGDPTRPTQQRFVVYGLGGSGKTELSFRFADGYRHKFWGVFFVDGSSQKNASSTYAEIATIGGVEPNEKAAKHWLVTRALPWLLIIDNVDDDQINLDELLPQGTKGCILITTRNPGHKTYGNVGERYLELLPMDPDEAETLIIKAAEEPRPWPKLVVESASAICYALGFLPLALDQAAKAIRYGICEWPDYLVFFDRQIQRVRRTLHGRGRSNSRGRRPRIDDEDSSMNVFTTYEILYESLVSSPKEKYQDAVELLHVFSYFHFQNIRLDTLISSAINSLKEEDQQKEDGKREKEVVKKLAKRPRKPWIMLFREIKAELNWRLAIPAPMPGVLRNRDRLGIGDLEDEVQVRLRHALGVLIERSLVMRQDRATGRYSMHRLIHRWVRERPEMSTAHQALWCQVSITTLASSIRRPPHGGTKDEVDARRELLPHIRHARECEIVIEKRLADNVATAKPLWPTNKSYGRLQIEQDVRFSRVYAESAYFDEARELQERAAESVAQRLGPDHPIAIQLSLLLSGTLWEMSEIDKATRRLRQARELCIGTWGEDHPLTLDVTDALGSALSMKGRWAESKSLHSGNLTKMETLYGKTHEKTLKCIRNLARLEARYMNYAVATELCRTAWHGMKETLGPTHLETLISQEDLAMCYLRYGDNDPDPDRERNIAQSHESMLFVYEQRRALLGPEQHYTLLAILYLARIKSVGMGLHAEAERMIRDGLKIAERNIGKTHIAVLMAKSIFAEVLTKLGKYEEAESLFQMLIDKKWYSALADEDGDHPDRLGNLWLFVGCLEEQGKMEEALIRCEELLAGMARIGGNGTGMRHKTLVKFRSKAERLRGLVGGEEVHKGV